MCMRKLLLLSFCTLPLLAQPSVIRFPAVERLEQSRVDARSAWKIVRRIEPRIDGQNIYSLKVHPDGKSVIVGSTDFFIFRVSLSDGRMLWKTEAKMKYQKEFDGPEIYDISPDGKTFLSSGQTRPEEQASERFLVIRSCADGSIVRSFPVERSVFYSKSANVDYRYPGPEEEKERNEAGLAPNWILTLAEARFVEGGAKIIASFRHNMEGPNLYDRRLIVFEAQSGRKVSEMQLTCDRETANWEQPAGFEIGHNTLPFLYNPKRKSLIFGTAHGRIHEIEPAEMTRNQKIEAVEDKTPGKVLFVPVSTSEDMAEKDRQTIRYLAASPDGKTIFASAGTEAGFIQLYAFDYATKKEMFHSTLFDAGRILAPSADILVVGGIFSSGKFQIADIRSGRLVFAPEAGDDDAVSVSIFDTNPAFREVAALSRGNTIALIRPGSAETPW